MLRIALPGAVGLAAVVLSAAASAQSNLIPGTDVSLGKMDTISAMGRTGVFPNGLNGVAIATTSCNKGSVKVPWEAAMLEDHPFIGFLIARETDGRMTQVSDYSYVKHGFFALTDNFCDQCQEGPFGGGDVLGLGCSDTYGITNNGDQYWLGPPSEINPWLGTWDHVCSHFDKGEPPVTPALQCDGNRSFSTSMAQALNPVGHRMNITDAEFLTPGTWYYQGYYVIRGEPGDERDNNWGTRRFTPSWNGNKWNTASASGFQNGSVLERWTGATVTSGGNGVDDGRFVVGVKVTGPVEGMYHYEYAIQNRDNQRGGGDLSIPICPDARIENFGFSDVAEGTPWTADVNGASLDIAANGNPVRWNTIYNVWFDSDAAPVSGDLAIAQFDAGAGAASVTVPTTVPGGLYNVYLGDGCATGAVPSLYANGQATLGNGGFELATSGGVSGQLVVLAVSPAAGQAPLGGGCIQWFGGSSVVVKSATSDGSGVATYPAPIANDPAWEGASVYLQAALLNPGGGPFLGQYDVSNGLQVRIGNAVSSCP